MATVNTSGYRVIGAPWDNQLAVEELVYDFATDNMAFADDVKLGKITKKCILLSSCVWIETAFTSGGSATLAVGVTSDTNAILAATAVASLTLDSLQGNVTAGEGALSLIPADDFVVADVGTADMTAGKARVYMTLIRAA